MNVLYGDWRVVALAVNLININTYSAQISISEYIQMRLTSLFHPSHPRGGHPPHSNLVRGKLTSPTPTLQETGPTVLRPIREDENVLQ